MDDIIKQWVKDLRSGNYKQTERTLVDSNGYCCLGVYACVTTKKYTEENCVSKEKPEGTPEAYNWIKEDLHNRGIDIEIKEDLMDMNDSGSSFSDIADRIEEHFTEIQT